ncbi:hypothetical protein [Nocardia farcinica]|nr:hypothetical protein [Nocardia farcinica]
MNVLRIDAQAAGSDPASGTCVATGRWGNMPLRVAGPVTCLTINGNTVSPSYPITTSEPVRLFAPDSMAIQITVVKGENGEPNRIGYGAPMPDYQFPRVSARPDTVDFQWDHRHPLTGSGWSLKHPLLERIRKHRSIHVASASRTTLPEINR